MPSQAVGGRRIQTVSAAGKFPERPQPPPLEMLSAERNLGVRRALTIGGAPRKAARQNQPTLRTASRRKLRPSG